MDNHTFEPMQNLSLKKSNELISAKYNSTLLENQVMAVALTRIESKAVNNNTILEATLYPGELKKLIGNPTHIYRTLKVVAKTMIGHTMFMEDQKGNFRAHAIVTDATYENGTFRVRFNENLRSHILGLERNYTTLELSVLTEFRKNSSFRIYELLKKEVYKSDPSKNNGRVDVEYPLSEFRFMIGLSNSDDQLIKNEMARMGNNVDWDVLYNKLDKKERKYEAWSELVRNVIVPAQEELAEKSNIRFTFEGVKSGRKVSHILFSVYPNDATERLQSKERQIIINENKARHDFNIEKNSFNRQLEIPRDLEKVSELYDEFVGHNELTAEDIDVLVEAADYNKDLIREAINLADEQPGIDSYMGWIIACIKAGGYRKIETINGSHDAAVAWKEYKEKSNTPEAQKQVWEYTKSMDDFSVFLRFETEHGTTLEMLDFYYSPREALQEYINWKMAKAKGMID